jgi:NAD(P)-dependent dehydrogenase (short-subunit alcohol dehydrogenase family)
MVFKDINFDFSGKTILVIGGSRGIGKGVVDAFLAAGGHVFYASRTPMIENTKGIFVRTDLSKPEEITSLFQKINKGGGIDIVVNSAAINYCKPIDEITTDEWDEVFAINLRATFQICKLALREMKKKNYGKIVNISSIAGRHRSIVSGVHYVSSKAGLLGLTRQIAFLAAQHNINVNVVCPSQTMTDMLQKSMTKEQIAALSSNIPLKRIATVREQVGPILFLCSEAASYITGAVIDVNGGQI